MVIDHHIFGIRKISKQTIIASAIILISSILLRSANLIIIVASLVVLYRLYSPLINKIVFDSKLLILILIFFSYAILLQCAVLISWLLNRNFPLSLTPLLLLIILSVMYIYSWYIHRNNPISNLPKINKKIFNLQDVLSLLSAIVIIGIVVLPPIWSKPQYPQSTSVMSLVSGNVDDSSHLSLLNDNLQFDRGIIFKSDAQGKTRNDGFYPAGWPSISAVFIKMFYPAIQTGSASLIAYGIQKLFWFFILLYLLTRVTFILYRFLSNKKIKPSSYVWIPSLTIFLGYTLLLPIFMEGFYSFLPQLIATLLAIPVIIQLTKEKGLHNSYRSLPFLFVICVGGCLPWLLPLPAFLLAVLALIIGITINKKLKITIKNISTIIREDILLLLLLAAAFATQIFVMTSNHSDSSISFMQGIMLSGGITTYDKLFYIFISAGFLSSLILTNKKIRKHTYLLLSLIASLLLFCACIYLLQIRYMGHNEYYYFKILDILTLAATPFCIIGFGFIIDKIAGNGKNIFFAIILSAIFTTTLLQLIGLDSMTLDYTKGNRAFSSQIDNSILDELNSHISQANYFNKNYTFYYIPYTNFYFQNEVAGMMAKSNTPDSNCFSSIRHSIWKTPPINQLLNDIATECKGYYIDIVTNQENFKAFEDAVNNAGLDNSVKVKTY